ncbi:MAG: hypothetical protein IPP60_15455 [Sphingobacteriales bacterium]|nr:hypothetical protein [Sphingobacteriales bacterium]
MHKIIPIKYRDCIIPSEIINLLYGDLSKEIVQIIDDKVKFTTDGYTPFLNKLIKTLNTPTDKKLTNQDKIELKEEFKQNESIISKNRDSIATLYLQVAAYSDSISLKEFKDKVNKYLPEPDENINPIVLPRVIKNIFTNVKIGEPLTVTFDSKNNHVGHFAGFRRDDIKITVSPDIRHQIEIIKDQRYVVKFDANNKSIDFNEM